MGVNRNIKIAVVILGFAVAGTIFAINSGGDDFVEEVPDDVQRVDLVCVASGAHVRRPFEEIRAFGMRPRGGRGRASRDAGRVDVVVYPVGECGDTGAVLADYCRACEKYFPKWLPDGSVGKCPVCER